MNSKTPFGAALRYYRKKENLTQPKLGEKVGCSRAIISNIERGAKDGPVLVRDRIIHYFGTSYVDFIKTGREKLAEQTIKYIPDIPFDPLPELEDQIQDVVKKIVSNVMLRKINYSLQPIDPTDILCESFAIQYVDEALEKTGIKITAKQREKFIKILKEDMLKNIKQTRVNLKKYLAVFKERE